MLRYEGAGAGHEEEGKDPPNASVLFEQLLVQAAEWKLQAKTLTQQATVMQAQVNTLSAPWSSPGSTTRTTGHNRATPT